MLTLHHLEYSQSFRVLWLLEELGVEYRLEKYNRDPLTQLAPEAYKQLSPLGTAPVIEHDSLVLAETSAIVDYLLDVYTDNSLRPSAGSGNRARYLFWFHASQGSIMPLMLMNSIFRIMEKRTPAPIRLFVRPVLGKASQGIIRPRLARLFELAEKDLACANWFGGEQFSAADILLSYPIESASARGFLGEQYPLTRRWLENIHARPAFRRARDIDGRPSMVLPL